MTLVVSRASRKLRFVGRIGTDKRACSHAFPGIHLILELSRYADLSGVDSDNFKVNSIGHPIRLICFLRNRWPDIES